MLTWAESYSTSFPTFISAAAIWNESRTSTLAVTEHDHVTARELQDSITHAHFSQADFGMSADDHRALLVSGDLTRIGANDDFIQSLTFLGSQLWWHRNRNRQVETNGLNWAGTIYTVPGNHDHWKGFRPDFRVSLRQPLTWHRLVSTDKLARCFPRRSIRIFRRTSSNRLLGTIG